MLRITIYYSFSFAIMALYGGQVCPFIDTLTLMAWGKTLLVFFLILFIIRSQLIKHFVFSKPPMEQPRKQMVFELSLFIISAICIALYNHFVYLFPPIGSGGKVLVGMFTLGSFLGIDMALYRERQIIIEAKDSGNRFAPPPTFHSVTKKFTVFAILVLSFVSTVIMLVIGKDLTWISAAGAHDIRTIQRTITFEVLFVVAVTLALVLNLIYSYSKNLKIFFSNETQVLNQVIEGNLDGYVPVVSNDEFAHIAEHTNHMIDGLREKRRIKNIFGKVVSTEVANHLLSSDEDALKPGGEKRDLVILMSDIRGFTSLTEAYPAEDLVLALNKYFSDMVGIIHKEQGIVDKFIGDGILAVFGLTNRKDAAKRATQAALNMIQVANQNPGSYGLPIKVGIGVHGGEVIIGNIGAVERLEYTVIGDPVNTTARLERLTKQFDIPLMISRSVHDRLDGQQKGLAWQEFGKQELEGKAAKIEVLGLALEHQRSLH